MWQPRHLLVFAGVALLVALAPPASAGVSRPEARNIFKTGGDVTVGIDQVVGTVVLLGGDLKVVGRVDGSALVIGGDVSVLPTGVVSRAVVCLGGTVRREPGAIVAGNVVSIGGRETVSRVAGAFSRAMRSPFRPGTMIGWATSTVLYMIVALVAATFFPRALAAVRDRAVRRPAASFGWGALGSLVIVPAVSVLLLVSVIGILVLIPWLLIVVPLSLFFGFAAVSALLGRWALRGLAYRRENLVLAAVGGALLLHVVRLIPYLGAAAWAVAWLTGFGAVAVGVWEWWRRRRRPQIAA